VHLDSVHVSLETSFIALEILFWEHACFDVHLDSAHVSLETSFIVLEILFWEYACFDVHLDSAHVSLETSFIVLEIPRAKSDSGCHRRPMALPYGRERRLEANHIHFCGR
jgi:hypothetical protein